MKGGRTGPASRWLGALVVAAALAICPQPVRAQGMPVRGWLVHSPDRAYLERVLQAAPRYGVNHFELSHDVVMQADEVTQIPGRAALIEAVARRAQALGIKTYIWCHELNTRAAKLVLDPKEPAGAAFWEARQRSYRRALEACPSLAGVVLMFGSSPSEVWEVGTGDPFWKPLSMPDRLRFVIGKVKAVVVKEKGKELFVRDFNHSPSQLEWLIEALRDDGEITAVSKPEPQDFQPFYPPSPALGALGKTRQILELDLNGEYWGQSLIPVAQVAYLKRLFGVGRARGVRGAVGRIDTYDHWALGTPSEINLFAYARLLADPNTSEAAIYDGWIEQRYGLASGTEAARALRAVFERTFPMAEAMFYTQGFWTWKDQTSVPDRGARIDGGIAGKSVALWNAAYKETERRLVRPDREMVRAILEEKRKAVALAEANLSDLQPVKRSLAPTDAADFERRLRLAVDWAKLYEAIASAYWRVKLAGFQPDAPEAAEPACEVAIGQLDTLADRFAERYRQIPFFAKQSPRIRALAADLRARRARQPAPLPKRSAAGSADAGPQAGTKRGGHRSSIAMSRLPLGGISTTMPEPSGEPYFCGIRSIVSGSDVFRFEGTSLTETIPTLCLPGMAPSPWP